MKNMKKGFVYAIAAIVAVIIALLAYSFLSKKEGQTVQTQQPVQQQEKTISIVVAKQDIPADTVITAEMLETRDISEKDQATIQAETSPQTCIGYTARVDITAQQPLYSSILRAPDAIELNSKLSYKVADGMVGIAIESEYLTAIAGYLCEGDYVNIISDSRFIQAAIDSNSNTYGTDEDYEKSNPSQSYLAQNVKVLAVGDKEFAAHNENVRAGILNGQTTEQTVDNNTNTTTTTTTDDGYQYDYAYVVLQVNDEIARIITEVEKNAKLTLTLTHRAEEIEEMGIEPYLVGPTISSSYNPSIAGQAAYTGTYVVTTPTPTTNPSTPTNSIIYG